MRSVDSLADIGRAEDLAEAVLAGVMVEAAADGVEAAAVSAAAALRVIGKTMTAISKELLKQIKDRVDQVESKTSVEIVPVMAAQSSDYYYYRFDIVFGVVTATFFALMYFLPDHPFFAILGIAIVAGALSKVIVSWPPILQRILPNHIKQHEVQEAAHRFFLKEEVFATRHRNGVLIFISELERSVFILADKGFKEKQIPEKYWSELAQRLAQDLSKLGAAKTFLEALDSLADELVSVFPKVEGESSQLSSEVRVEDHDH